MSGAGISGWQLLVLLLIVILIFGTKRLRTIGSDLGGAFRDFRKGVREGEVEDEGADGAVKPNSDEGGKTG